MCGLLGCFVKNNISEKLLKKSLKLMSHRGPDSSNFQKYTIDKSFLYFCHARLAIIDLSKSGSQPFSSTCGNYSIIFNGEIYNYIEIKQKLIDLGYKFKTKTDTEVLLYALIEWGTDCLKQFVGMFAFSFFDKKQKKILFARDAFGIKPLFYFLKDEEIFFSSTINSLKNLVEKKFSINFQRSYDYLIHGDYDSNDSTFIKNVNHLPAAHYFYFDLNTKLMGKPTRWWSPNISSNRKISFHKASLKLRELFIKSVKLHLRSDVPLGIALSGGIDSSAVACVANYLNSNIKINTFSFISEDKKISEEKWIDNLNFRFNFRSHKIKISSGELESELQDLLEKQEEPFGSTSIYAQYKVYQKAKQKGFKVILDGQGADELLAGYYGYPGFRILSLLETKGLYAAHKFAKNWSKSFEKSYFIAWFYLFRIILPDQIYRIVRLIFGRNFKPSWFKKNFLKKEDIILKEQRSKLEKKNRGHRVKEAMLRAITDRGLQGLLRHADRNSMAFSIESRVPFLTIPIAEYLFSLPENYLISDKGLTKNIFRSAMKDIVPDQILNRKDKIGFETNEKFLLTSKKNIIKKWIFNACYPNFINKQKLIQEIEKITSGKMIFDNRIWRYINYIHWCNSLSKKNKKIFL